MLRRVRSHAQGLRFHEALTNSPLTILYQCIGNIKAAQLEDALKTEVSDTKDALIATPISFRIKNSLAIATGRPDVATCLQATNLLVGWDLQSKPISHSGETLAGPKAIKFSTTLSQLVADTASAATQPESRQQPPQRTLAALIKASLKLADKYPLAPLAGFFFGQRIRLADLTRWSELDDMTVYAELLMQLNSAPHGLVQSIDFGDGGISALLDGQSAPLLACLEARKAAEGADAAAGATSTGSA